MLGEQQLDCCGPNAGAAEVWIDVEFRDRGDHAVIGRPVGLGANDDEARALAVRLDPDELAAVHVVEHRG